MARVEKKRPSDVPPEKKLQPRWTQRSLRTVAQSHAEKLETVSLPFYRVVVRVVVVAVLRDFPTRIIQDGSNHSGFDVDELLVRSLGGRLVSLSGPHDQEHAVGQRGENTRIRGRQNRRCVQNYQIEVLRELLQQHAHPNAAQEVRSIGRQSATRE